MPWKGLPALTGSVEKNFIRSTLVGDSVLPFRLRPPQEAIIPWDGTTIDKTIEERLDYYPGLAAWWRHAESVWKTNKTENNALTLTGRINYQRGLANQLPGSPIRVVYSASGMYLAAAVVDDPNAVVEHKLYWAAVATMDEAHYLLAVLNSTTVLELTRPLQARGEHNPRDFDKYVWQAPIPLYDASNGTHQKLVEVGKRAAQIAEAVELPTMSFQALRRRIRTALQTAELAEWEPGVAELLGSETEVTPSSRSEVR